MEGMFNPKSDPVTILFDAKNSEFMERVFQPNALTASKVWSVYSDEDFLQDIERLG
jgi:hypothetical protein